MAPQCGRCQVTLLFCLRFLYVSSHFFRPLDFGSLDLSLCFLLSFFLSPLPATSNRSSLELVLDLQLISLRGSQWISGR